MIGEQLALPPGFAVRACASDACDAAVRAAGAGADPGLVLFVDRIDCCEFAIVLTPEVAIDDVTMLGIASRAVHHGLAGLAPAGIPIDRRGAVIRVNGAEAAGVALHRPGKVADDSPDDQPDDQPDVRLDDWLVLGIDVAIDFSDDAPGDRPDRTCLAEEGFRTGPAELMGAICRHLLTGFDAWTEQLRGRAAA